MVQKKKNGVLFRLFLFLLRGVFFNPRLTFAWSIHKEAEESVKSLTRICLAAVLFASLVAAQTWEAGGLGGFGITPSTSVTSPSGSASTGFKNGGTFGVFGGANDYSYIGGEASYLYRMSDLKVASGGTQVDFAGHTQFLDFRFLVHFASREKRFRPFVAAGGGVAIYSGTGEPNAAQPLNNFVEIGRAH